MHRLVPVLLITAYCRTAADAISVQGFNFPCQELPSLPQLRVHMLHLLAAGEGSLLDHAMVVYGSGLSDAKPTRRSVFPYCLRALARASFPLADISPSPRGRQ